MVVAGLYSGIGGFELAFARAGFETKLLCDSDPHARNVLRQHFPEVELREDVSDLQELPVGTMILTAGFPCQNLSMAGNKSGITGSESGTVGRMFDLIERSIVPTVVIENVYFMLHLGSGNAMAWLTSNFERLGYKWAYRVLDTMGFGLPQRRRRVYLVASTAVDPRGVLFADEAPPRAHVEPDLTRPLGFYWTEGRSGVGFTVDAIPPLKVGSGLGIPSAPAVLFPDDGEVLVPSASACERLQGFPAEWTGAEGPNIGRSSRWRLIGNAASVPVAEWVATRLATPRSMMEFPTTLLKESGRWPDAAWNVGEGRTAVVAGDQPIPVELPSISRFRDLNWTRLSDRALDGFIRRAVEGGLRMPAGFLDALRSAQRKQTFPHSKPRRLGATAVAETLP